MTFFQFFGLRWKVDCRISTSICLVWLPFQFWMTAYLRSRWWGVGWAVKVNFVIEIWPAFYSIQNGLKWISTKFSDDYTTFRGPARWFNIFPSIRHECIMSAKFLDTLCYHTSKENWILTKLWFFQASRVYRDVWKKRCGNIAGSKVNLNFWLVLTYGVRFPISLKSWHSQYLTPCQNCLQSTSSEGVAAFVKCYRLSYGFVLWKTLP